MTVQRSAGRTQLDRLLYPDTCTAKLKTQLHMAKAAGRALQVELV